MDVAQGEVSLTKEQENIVTLGARTQALVTAAAGTGKTHVLVDRLSHLVEVQGLSPGSEILVLSFSRAAVTEVRNRLLHDGDATLRVVERRFVDHETNPQYAACGLGGLESGAVGIQIVPAQRQDDDRTACGCGLD